MRLGSGLTGYIQTFSPASASGGGGPGAFSTITASGAASITGVLTPLAGITGVTTNSSASAGLIGQFVTSNIIAANALALTTTVVIDVTSISLTAGDWDVSALLTYNAFTTTIVQIAGGISLTTAALPSSAGGGALGTQPLVIDQRPFALLLGNYQLALPPVRVLLAGTTTIFLVATADFSVGSMTVFGNVRARRMR